LREANCFSLNKLHKYRFGRNEKLKSRKAIGNLFSAGEKLNHFPFRCIWLYNKELPYVRVAVSVSSRNFKKAVHRNRIKRLMREAYRLNKELLVAQRENTPPGLDIMIIYTGKELPEFDYVEQQIKKLLSKISASIEHH